VDDVGHVDLGDVGSAPGSNLDQVLEREALDRLAQRRSTDLELLHQPVLDQRGAGRQAQRHDPVAQLGVRPIGDQPGRGAVSGLAISGRWRGGLTAHVPT